MNEEKSKLKFFSTLEAVLGILIIVLVALLVSDLWDYYNEVHTDEFIEKFESDKVTGALVILITLLRFDGKIACIAFLIMIECFILLYHIVWSWSIHLWLKIDSVESKIDRLRKNKKVI